MNDSDLSTYENQDFWTRQTEPPYIILDNTLILLPHPEVMFVEPGRNKNNISTDGKA